MSKNIEAHLGKSMVIYGINRINVNLVYSVNAIQQIKYYLKWVSTVFKHAFSCHEINLEKGTLKQNLKNVDFCSYIGMHPHF